jgi:FkbM family methyltransferase
MILSQARKLARNLGLDVQRANHLTIPELRLVHFLACRKIHLVIDIGANTGQFARALFSNGYTGRVISVEPIPATRQQLVAAARGRRNWVIAPALALGAVSGSAQFHVAENSVSSLLRVVLQPHLAAAPLSRQIETIEVEVRRLDEMLEYLEVIDKRLYLKLDTRGTEDEVLDGAAGIFERVVGIQVELSRKPGRQCVGAGLLSIRVSTT